MSVIIDSNDAQLRLVEQIRPDWSRGVRHFTLWTTNKTVARSGIDQRIATQKIPRKSMEFEINAMNATQSEDFLAVLENRGRGPLEIPWWPEGLRLSTSMVDVNEAQIEIEPLFDWIEDNQNLLIGDEVRNVLSRSGRTLTLEPKAGATAQAAVKWCYPMKKAVLDTPNDAAMMIRHDAVKQRIRFIASV